MPRQVMKLDSSSKEDRAKKLPKKDIRSGREYYEGWDKYVSHWEKVITMDPAFIMFMDQLALWLFAYCMA